MSQALSNLAVGSKVKFGKYSVNGEAAQPIVWTIVAKNHTGYPDNSVTLFTSKIIDLRCFDAKEPNSSDSNRQQYGNNRYSVSNIDQWLNKDSAAGEWYVAAHSTDSAPTDNFASRPGFLNTFSSLEKDAILSTTIRSAKPSVDGGSYEDIERKVFLPSTTETYNMASSDNIKEGSYWNYTDTDLFIGRLTEQCYNNTVSSNKPNAQTNGWFWWYRTPIQNDSYDVMFQMPGGISYEKVKADDVGVRPVVNLTNTLKVSDTVDGDGCYTFMWPANPMPWVGGTETYTENIQVQRGVSMQDNSNTLTEDRQDELWKDEYYYEGSSTANSDSFHLQFRNDQSDGMRFLSRHFTTDKVGTTITSKITFLKAFKNVKISSVRWLNNTDGVDTTTETCTVKLNDTSVYTVSATKEQYTTYTIVARDITIGNVAVGDVISFEDSKNGTISGTSAYRDLVGGLRFYFSSDPVYFMETVPVQKTRGINKPVSSIYAGVTATVPKYTETTTTEDVALSTNTFTDFFSADNTGTTGTNAKGITWANNSGGGLKLTFGNYGINSSTSMTTFTTQRALTNVVIKGLYYTENRYDKITLIVAGTTVLDAVSGTSSTLTQRWTGSLSKGQTIVLKYVKDGSNSDTNEGSTYFTLSCNPYQKTVTTQTQTGTETKLVDKKIVKGYVGGPDGKARLFFGGGGFSYTGEYTEQDYISTSGTKYKLYTLTTGGEMKLTQEARYWMCGGGANGGISTAANGVRFGGGGGYILDGVLTKGEYTVNVGAGGTPSSSGGWGGSTSTAAGASSIIAADGITKTANGGKTNGKGGSAGGGYSKATSSSATSYSSHSFVSGPDGAGVSTIPFGIVTLYPHSPGGGGGSVQTGPDSNGRYYHSSGTYGGSNGGRGGTKNTQGYLGGYKGGGMGALYGKGGNATFYGGGGGGAEGGLNSYPAGSGYQGVVYIMQKIGTAQSTMVLPLILGDIIKYNQSIYTKVTVGSTTYETETETTVNKGANIMVIACRRGIYYNGTKVVAASTTGTVNYTFTMQTPTLIYCDYNNTYIVTEEGKETA